MAGAETRRYWSWIASHGCLICGGPSEVAHAHGGSIVERMQEPKAKGVKLARYDWLVIPLCPAHHRLHNDSLDHGVDRWELRFGRQADWIDVLVAESGINVWALAARGGAP